MAKITRSKKKNKPIWQLNSRAFYIVLIVISLALTAFLTIQSQSQQDIRSRAYDQFPAGGILGPAPSGSVSSGSSASCSGNNCSVQCTNGQCTCTGDACTYSGGAVNPSVPAPTSAAPQMSPASSQTNSSSSGSMACSNGQCVTCQNAAQCSIQCTGEQCICTGGDCQASVSASSGFPSGQAGNANSVSRSAQPAGGGVNLIQQLTATISQFFTQIREAFMGLFK